MDIRPETSRALDEINQKIPLDTLLVSLEALPAGEAFTIHHLIEVLEQKLFKKVGKTFEPQLDLQNNPRDQRAADMYKKGINKALTLVEGLLLEAEATTTWDKSLRADFPQKTGSSEAIFDGLVQLQSLLQSYLDLFAEWETTPLQEIEISYTEAAQKIRSVEHKLNEILIGQETAVRQVLIALFAGGHLLLEGNPGLGKTKLAESLGKMAGLRYSRVSCTPDLTPTDVLGGYAPHLNEAEQLAYAFKEGPVFTNILLLDELNRATPKTQSALLEAMEEKQVTNSRTRKLPNPFFVIATQNNKEEVGTYPLPKAQLDRFLLKVTMDLPENKRLSHMLQTALGGRDTGNAKQQLLTIAEVRAIQKKTESIAIPAQIYDYAANILKNTHPDPERSNIESVRNYVEVGASPRGLISVLRGAQAHALLNERTSVSIDDITAVAHAALCHRITINAAGLADSISPEQIIDDVLQNTTMN